MKDNRKNTDNAAAAASAAKPAFISRRNLLKQGAVAMPAVLTLQSGAALAASSAYIGSVSRGGSQYVGGNVLCLDTRNAEPLLPNGTTYKFVDTNYADVYVIPDGQYYATKGRDDSYVLSDEFCRTGGTKYLDASGWPQVDLPTNGNGILVSSTALSSIAAALDVKMNYLP